jgi:hypothetical protein
MPLWEGEGEASEGLLVGWLAGWLMGWMEGSRRGHGATTWGRDEGGFEI